MHKYSCFSPLFIIMSIIQIEGTSLLVRGWTLLLGNTRPDCFYGVSNFREKKGLKFLGENLKGLKSISKFDQISSKSPFSWKLQIQISQKSLQFQKSEKPISLIFEWNKGCQIYMEKIRGLKIYSEKIRGLKILGLSEENTPGGYSPLKMSAPLIQYRRFLVAIHANEWSPKKIH